MSQIIKLFFAEINITCVQKFNPDHNSILTQRIRIQLDFRKIRFVEV